MRLHPKRDPLTSTDLKTLRKILENHQSELAIGNREALVVEAAPDEMDRVQHFSEREYAMNHLERNSKRLREVKAALQRMDEGTYGVCIDCETDVNLKRLTAVPWAATCITCQEAAERAGIESGDEIDLSGEVAA